MLPTDTDLLWHSLAETRWIEIEGFYAYEREPYMANWQLNTDIVQVSPWMQGRPAQFFDERALSLIFTNVL